METAVHFVQFLNESLFRKFSLNRSILLSLEESK